MIKLSSRLKRARILVLSRKSLTMLKAVPKFLLSSGWYLELMRDFYMCFVALISRTHLFGMYYQLMIHNLVVVRSIHS